MNILVISPDYPDKHHNGASFVQQLVNEFARIGHNCLVLSPHSITTFRRLSQGREIIQIGKGNIIIERPNYITVSSFKVCGVEVSSILRQKTINRVIRKMTFKPDIVYGHFWRCGYEGFKYAKRNNLPLFVASGESVIPSLDSPDKDSFYQYVKGVICVSTKNKMESIEKGMTSEQKCIVLPNAINQKLFKKIDKKECRKKLNIPDNAFVTATLGWFSQRKGQQRVAEAINILHDESIKSIFIGGGNDLPEGKHIIFRGQVMHDDVPVYLNAADVYVLPTRAEGCCNSIIEAMACGLPVVSSDLPFNYDICDNSNSILVNPDSIEGIADAIKKMKNNLELRGKLSEGAVRSAQHLTIEKRAEKIIEFIENRIS